jgi:aspartate aminotransferase
MTPTSTRAARPALSQRLQALKPSPTIAMDARAKALRAAGADVLALTLGEPEFDTPEHIKAAAQKAIRDGKTNYTPSGGIPELRQAVCTKLARDNGVAYDPTETVICVGGKQVLYNLMLALLDPGDEVVVPVPAWPTFADQVGLVGGVPVLAALPADKRLRAQDVAPYLTPRTRAIVVNTPSNPTGAVMRPEDVRAVTALAVERGVYVISDETYEHFLFGGATHVSPASLGPEAKEWTVVVNTVSKTYAMTGWRIGYAAGPQHVMKAVDSLMTQTTSNPCSVAQWAAVEALTGPQDCVGEMVAEFGRRREFFVAGLNRLGLRCDWPEGAFYAYPRVPDAADGGPGNSMAFATRLAEEAHLVTVPGSAFFDEGYLRMSYAASTATLAEALQRLGRFV